MMQTKFVPSLITSNPNDFEGHVMIKHPTFDDRMSFFEDLGIDMDAMLDSEKKDDLQDSLKKNGIKFIRIMSRKLKDFITEVKITRKEDGFLFDSYDSLQSDSGMHGVIMELSFKLMGEFKAAKN